MYIYWMNNCVNFDVVFIKWYLSVVVVVWVSAAVVYCQMPFPFAHIILFRLFPSSTLFFFLSFFLPVLCVPFFYSVLNLHAQSLAPLWAVYAFFFKYYYLMKLYWNWPNNNSSDSSNEWHSSAVVKICSLRSTSLYGFSTFIYIHNFMKFVCLLGLICFVCRWSHDLSFLFLRFFCIHQSRLYRCRFIVDYNVSGTISHFFCGFLFSQCKQTVFFCSSFCYFAIQRG